MRLVLSWARRTPHERVILLEAAFLLLWAAVRLALGQKWLLRRLQPPVTSGINEPAPLEAAQFARAVQTVAAHLPIRTGCLARSLALHGLLRRHGLPAELQLGAASRNSTGRPQFHAWVTSGGRTIPVGMDSSGEFVPLATHRS
jgi:hypothetical protein